MHRSQPNRFLPNGKRIRCGRRGQRRGVLLLVVLSILVLFAVVGVTFALVSSQFRRGSLAGPRIDQYAVSFKDQLDDAAKQVFRGSKNPLSVLTIHSLLEDMYGYDGIVNTNVVPTVQIVSVAQTNGTNGQLLDISLSGTLPYTGTGLLPPTGTLYPTGQIAGYFNGRVMTMTSGPLAGRSTRIVGYSPTASTLRVMAFEGSAILPGANQNFVINGRPFNGVGFGYNSSTGLVNAKDGNSTLFALLPNQKYPSGSGTYSLASPFANADADSTGGADEDYDAADWNNMLLGLVTSPAGGPYPSLHRPELINFFLSQASPPNGWLDPSFTSVLRQIMLRPSPGDHPNFTGSNPSFNPTTGPWDVDTDGDGVPDSVWVDLGFPVQTAPDGTSYKPLFAIRCLDLDGRLNLNAQGSSAQVESTYGQAANGFFANATNSSTSVTPSTILSPAGTVSLGSGYGPSDINLFQLYSQQGLGIGAYQALFAGNAAQYIEGRNGELPLAGNGSYNAGAQPSGSTPPYAGYTSGSTEVTASPLGFVKHFELPVPGSPLVPSAYGSPPDLWARGFVALDIQGTPLTPNMSSPPTGGYDTLNNPYLLNLSKRAIRGALSHGAIDNPFSPAELEAVLRAYDLDAASLSNRLARLLDPTYSGSTPLGTWLAQLRNQVTTDSFDLPSPNILATRDMRVGASGTSQASLLYHPADIIAAKLTAGGGNVQTQLPLLVPPDLLNGLRLDINRPFGNGHDDDNNGVVDDYNEYASGEPAWNGVFPSGYSSVSLAVDYSGNGSADASDALFARQQMAKYLYTLAMALVDQNLVNSSGTNPPPLAYDANGLATTSPQQYQVQYALAQWAINCVDFRDRDSIMTPFEFDLFPFDNTPIDGIISGMFGASSGDDASPQRGLVWGCERPELLINETLAWHDRKTQDLWSGSTPTGPTTAPGNYTTTGGGHQSPSPPLETDFDQHLVPQAAAFIELYNPWNTQNSILSGDSIPTAAEVPGEFYNVASGSPTGVVLNATTPAAGGPASPVWRLVLSPAGALGDPDDPVVANRPAIERTVYFVAAATPGTPPSGVTGSGLVQYYTSQAVAPLKPGRYAVVGSAGQNITGQYVSKIGRTTSATDIAPDTVDTRRIVLQPNANPDTNQVQVLLSGQTTPADPSTIGGGGSNVQPVVAVALDTSVSTVGPRLPASFGVSDPVNGYNNISTITNGATIAAVNPGPPTSENELAWSTAQDKPSDNFGDSSMLTDGTKAGYKIVHLQRLANPLATYDPNLNPYMTIDSAPIDVRAFNGVWNQNADPNAGAAPVYNFASTQRGDQYLTAAANMPPQISQGQNNVLWAHEYAHVLGTGVLQGAAGAGNATQIFPYSLHHSLGFLSQAYGAGPGNVNYLVTPAAYVGALSASTGANQPPFPWLTWNNRPYVSPMELALVPKSRSSRLLYDFSLTTPTQTSLPSLYTTQSAYPITVPSAAGGYALAYNAATSPVPYFGHLLNFFDAGNINTASNNYLPANLYRIFEYLQVPSKFVGTETVLSPTGVYAGAFSNPPGATMGGDSGGVPYGQGSSSFGTYLRPPLNKVSEYRDPGRININTVTDPVVTQAIVYCLGDNSTNLVNDIVASRRGTANMPSYFANPFRSFAGAALTNSIYADSSLNGGSPGTPLRDIDVTLLRPSALNTSGGVPAPTALFDFPGIATGSSWQPYDDPTRNPYFRIQNAGKVTNLLTTRSNVYAVWITVGYFQVTPAAAPVNVAVYPDGYQLGAELGSDSGEIKRHRAFYIFDRTIPVGFQRGEDLNVDNAVLLRRFIE